MKVLRPGGDPAGLFSRLASAPSRVLLVDYDGTLAPFREKRDEALPYPGAKDALRGIQEDGRTRVIVVSGRSLANLEPLLGLDPTPELWGSHGWERLRTDGSTEMASLGDAPASGLESALNAASALVPSGRVERKPASVAVHVRGMPEPEAGPLLARVRAAWTPLLEGPLQLHNFDGGIELRVAGRDKGTAVREILSEEPPRAVVAYLGDDTTDEDAFRALTGRGLSVLVRGDLRETAADLWIRPPDELVSFLLGWLEGARSPLAPFRT